MTRPPSIQAERIVKNYGRKTALDGVSITVKGGEVHVLLGRNGSGKSTLAKVLVGATEPDSGRVQANGVQLQDRRNVSEFRKRVGFLLDTSAHWESLSGRENARFYARSFGLSEGEADARVRQLLREFALDRVADDQVSTYSFGMRRKLALVQALVHLPEFVVLDEPSIGLDHEARTRLYQMLRLAASQGRAVVIATNDTNEARHIADIVSLMDRGRVVASGSPEELIDRLKGKVMIRFGLATPPSMEVIDGLEGVLTANISDDDGRTVLEVMTRAEDETAVVQELMKTLEASGVRVERIDMQRPGLGDVLMRFAGGDANET